MPIQAASLYALVTVAGAERATGQLRGVSNQVDQTQGILNRAQAATAGWGSQMARGAGQVAGGLVRIGEKAAIAAVVAGGAAAKIAISFEDAFAAVEKTVEGSAGELDAIDQALRKLSTNIPVSFQGLATIASEAGALNVATKDIVKFTEAVARTSAATVGLSEFDASEAFGKLSTVFGLTGDRLDETTGKMVSDYERLGSTLVALGNAGASSEADIIAVTKRFASAGQQAGLSAAEVLGWSSALASLGPQAEAAGGALQRVFNRTTQNIGLMGVDGIIGKNATVKVDAFARVTGMSVKEFVALYTRDSSAALQAFVQGLGGLDKFEGARALREAGVINQRDILALQAFTIRYGELDRQVRLANKAWAEGTELQRVSEERFDTLKSKLTEFKNTVLVGAAAVGDGLTPALGRLVAKAQEFVELHMGDFSKLGRDIGAGLDSINWNEVRAGAQVFVDLLKEGFDILKQVPPKVAAIGVGFLGLNKLSGGMLGSGLVNLIAGLGKGVVNVGLNALSRVPGVGGAIGAATAARVFVVNFPPGFGAAPGAPGAPAAAAGLGLGSIASFAALAMLPVFVTGLTQAIINARFTPEELIEKADMERRATEEARGITPGTPGTGLPGRRGTASETNVTFAPKTPVLVRPIAMSPDERQEYSDRYGILLATQSAIKTGNAGTVGAIRALDANNATQTSLLSQIAGSTDLSAQRLRVIAGIEVKGKVPTVAHLGELGTKADPFGFKHLKAFALGQIAPKNTEPELVRHIGLVEAEIRKASAHGDPATVTKLRETKAGLESLLRDVRRGTFRAGERAYQGALVAAGAADRTTAAVHGVTSAIRGINIRAGAGAPGSAGRTGADIGSGISPTRPTSTSPVVIPHQVVPLATGGIVRARSGGVLALLGEGGEDEAVVPRSKWPGGSVQVNIAPQPVRLMLNGRELVTAMLLQDSFTRRAI